ncbi:unnamed protein product [Heligmosomoides polygyrus]|uniref:ATP-dependent DNA helicase n=1 Tax=Heligmosomoides polygyrus TaxID=6339 RepID=A0A183F4A0_HELPZ|nr:unnamed protein product [Heligmosomoides polygyrus]
MEAKEEVRTNVRENDHRSKNDSYSGSFFCMEKRLHRLKMCERRRSSKDFFLKTISKSTLINTIVLEKVTTAFSLTDRVGAVRHLCHDNLSLATARRKRILNVAWTGIAKNGRTVTSAFRLLKSLIGHEAAVKGSQYVAEVDAIIWDEAHMAPKLEAVNLLLQDIIQKNEPFEGKIMLLGKDFRQVLPVVEKGSHRDFVEVCFKMSVLWPLFKIHKLIANMRLNDYCHREWLLKIDENGDIKVPDDLICEGDIAEAIFWEALNRENGDFPELAVLTPRNVDALCVNDYVLDRLSGDQEQVVFLSEDEAIVEDLSDTLNFPTEFLNKMTPTGVPPHVLNLKVGCIVLLLRNLYVAKAYAMEHALSSEVLLPRIDCYFSQKLPFQLRRRQFPIRLSFAITINKSQEQSFSKVGIALSDPIFAHGLCCPFSGTKPQRNCCKST